MTWRLPKVGRLPKIIHIFIGFSVLNHPQNGGWTSPSMWPSAISGKKVP